MPDWFWFVLIFTWGCCIGSFLNVVIYRLPRDKSIVSPPSACPSCGKHIRIYDNIPLLSWLVLGRKCRFCKAPISPRYFAIELLTGLIFLGLFIVFFHTDIRPSAQPFIQGGWLVYLLHLILLGAFIAASAIDLELWIIPLNVCWFVTLAGFIGSAIGGYVIEPDLIRNYYILPYASAATGSLALGGVIGLVISLFLVAKGWLKRSYESEHIQSQENANDQKKDDKTPTEQTVFLDDDNFNHRLEALREIVFLLPIVVFSIGVYWFLCKFEPVSTKWQNISQITFISGLLGSLWGYFIGCGIVWAVRIFGTIAFGKEAMGLGDVHLMGAAGAVIGPVFVVIAFFVAPFFGLAWAGFNMFFKKIRQIPYGPFLSLGIFIVIILHDWIIENLLTQYI